VAPHVPREFRKHRVDFSAIAPAIRNHDALPGLTHAPGLMSSATRFLPVTCPNEALKIVSLPVSRDQMLDRFARDVKRKHVISGKSV
jgi:hypothetical protein